MAGEVEARFIALMSELFQLREAEELDFGIYRLIRRHNRRMREFLGLDEKGEPLQGGGEIDRIFDDAFRQVERADIDQRKRELARLGSAIGIPAHASQSTADEKLAEAETFPAMRAQVADYRSLRDQLHAAHTATDDRTEALNRLHEFYDRHYQDGDFIVQRRYGKDGARYVKSTGDDTEFRWATEDMYYIKSGDIFTDYPVRLSNGKALTFAVDPESLAKTRAELKPTDKAGYQFKAIRLEDGGLRVVLDYIKGAQNKGKLDKIVAEAATKSGAATDEVARQLRRYIARNQSDFFIHKRLREALDEDLDIFIKAEVLDAEQLLAAGDGNLAARAIRLARAVREIGRRINAFLGVLEDHQKRLWEKKKLVLETRYVITLDRIEKLAGKAFADSITLGILQNKAQVEEWQSLGLGTFATLESVRRTDGSYLPLPIDTRHFDEDFNWTLLANVTTSTGLDEVLDGVAIHSDNWQALNTLQEKYREQVKCCYIDPPYNTGGDGFPYKDAYQHASWVAMIEARLRKGAETLSRDGVIFSSIDQNEYPKLRTLLEGIFGRGNALGTIVWKNVTDNNPTNIAVEHEYVECFANSRVALESEWKSPYSDAKKLLVKLGRKLVEKYGDTPTLRRTYQEWRRVNKEFLGPLEGYKFIDGGGIYAGSRSVHNPGKEGYRYDIIHPTTKKPCNQPLMGYRFPEETYKKLHADGRIIFGHGENKIIELKVYAHEYEAKLPSVIDLDGRSGANDLTNLFGEAQTFKNPKAPALLQELVPYAAGKGDLIMDFFWGSGTTSHALMRLNRASGLAFRWLGVEASHNFDELIMPRLKKAAYSVEWLKGRPTDSDGPGVFVRVQVLEQYDDTLENLSVGSGESGNLFAGPEALAYDLDAEARQVLVAPDRFTAPFGMTLRRITNAEAVAGPVDLVESLVYLLGLHVARLYREQGSVVITGTLNGRNETAVVLWRDNVLHGEEWLQGKIAQHSADRYFTNAPETLSFRGIERFESIEGIFVEKLGGAY